MFYFILTQNSLGMSQEKIIRKPFNWEAKPEDLLSKQELEIKPLMDTISKIPENWAKFEKLSYQTSIYRTVRLDLESEEAKRVEAKFGEFEKLTLTIHKIERVQNMVAYNKYLREKEVLTQKYGDWVDKEKQLFYSSTGTDPNSLIDSELGMNPPSSGNSPGTRHYSESFVTINQYESGNEVRYLFL